MQVDTGSYVEAVTELYIALFQDYLVQFGYMSPLAMRSDSTMNQNAASEALTDFQTFAGLQPTGMLA